MTSDRSYLPTNWPEVIPRLSVESPEDAVRFIKEVFAAEGEFSPDRPTELRIGRSLVMVAGILERAPTSSFLYVYVPDTDAAYLKAIALGATSIEEPAEMPYGDRRGMIEDPWGNRWQIATHRAFDGDAQHEGEAEQ
jgi:PhnB protein